MSELPIHISFELLSSDDDSADVEQMGWALSLKDLPEVTHISVDSFTGKGIAEVRDWMIS